MTTHIASLEKIVEGFNITADCIYNLGEPDVSPNLETGGRTSKKYLLRSGKPKSFQICEATFSYIHRVTTLCKTCVEGTESIPMFVISGKDLPYRIIDKNNRWEHESIRDCLPTGSLVTTREDTASVDRQNFAEFATRFLDCVKQKTKLVRKFFSHTMDIDVILHPVRLAS